MKVRTAWPGNSCTIQVLLRDRHLKMNASSVAPAAKVETIDQTAANLTSNVAYDEAFLAVQNNFKLGLRNLASAQAGAQQLTCDFPTRFSGWRVLAQVLAKNGELLQGIALLEDCC